MTDDELKDLQRKSLIRLVDDDEDFLKSLAMLLSVQGWSVRTYSSADKFLADLPKNRAAAPGCLVLDLRMPKMTGLELQSRLRSEEGLNLPIIFLSGHGDIESAVTTMRHGAYHFLEKPANPHTLQEVMCHAVRDSLMARSRDESLEEARKGYESLSPREREVLLAASKGNSNKEIAESLGIGVGTVKMHRSHAFAKLGIHSPTEAANILNQLNRHA